MIEWTDCAASKKPTLAIMSDNPANVAARLFNAFVATTHTAPTAHNAKTTAPAKWST